MMGTSGGEGMEGKPTHLIDWKGKDWTPDSKEQLPTAIPAFTATGHHKVLPIFSRREKPEGLPVDIIYLRRGAVPVSLPLVTEALRLGTHGVFMGATAASRSLLADPGQCGHTLRPICDACRSAANNMGDYFQHWFDMR